MMLSQLASGRVAGRFGIVAVTATDAQNRPVPHRSRRGIGRGLALSVVLLLFLGTFQASTAGAARAGVEMSDEQAASYYLSAACRVGDSLAALNRAMFRGREYVTNRQVRNRFSAIKRTARVEAGAELTFARTLNAPPAPWPVDVQSPIATLSKLAVRTSVVFAHISRARTPRGVFYWYYSLRAPLTARRAPALIIRANLGLPRPGQGC